MSITHQMTLKKKKKEQIAGMNAQHSLFALPDKHLGGIQAKKADMEDTRAPTGAPHPRNIPDI